MATVASPATAPSTSPPRTPVDLRSPPTLNPPAASTPNSDDSSVIEDLSFEYIFDNDGNYVRLSKGSSKSNNSSPPTPQDTHLDPESHPSHPSRKNPSPPSSTSPVPRISLSRSESAYSVLTAPASTSSATLSSTLPVDRPHRSFQRVASGPAIAMTPSYAAPTASSSLFSQAKSRVGARRTTMEDSNKDHQLSAAASTRAARQTLDSQIPYTLQEEKENISESEESPNAQQPAGHSKSRSLLSSRSAAARSAYPTSATNQHRPLADVPLSQRQRQILPGPNRAGRVMKAASASSVVSSKYSTAPTGGNFDRVLEAEAIAHDEPIGITHGVDDINVEDQVDPAQVPLPPPGASSTIGRYRSTASNLNINIGGESLSKSGNTRPRRSASLSDALALDDYQLQVQVYQQNPGSRPGTSLGINGSGESTAGARRVTAEERDRQEMELRAEIKKYREAEQTERREQELHYQQPQSLPRKSPSPTHQGHLPPATSRPAYGHKRRDSDTLRSYIPPHSAPPLGSPTTMDPVGRKGASSPGAWIQGRTSPPTNKSRTSLEGGVSRSQPGRVSPPTKGGRLSPSTRSARVSPPPAASIKDKGRLSPPSGGASQMARDVAKHRRSPTAPEPPTTSGMINPSTNSVGSGAGKTWAAGSGEREREEEYEYGAVMEQEREKEKRHHAEQEQQRQQQQQQQYRPAPAPPQSAPANAPAPAPSQGQFNRHIVVNKKAYARLDMIGKGGSSRVFRVLNHANELYAIKRVSLDKTDAETMNGFMNEIALLKRLEGNSRIIRLIDSEVRAGPGGSKGHLLLVMECGEIDLARLLQEQMKEKVNMVWVAYYWQQMLQAVHVIHEEKIVHSDLKPANFVLVRGQLKLIDFGIANAIANDTTNIQRDHQIGTVNYMSPEAIELPDGMRRLKVGRPSDVWSLGCILYQMIYGQPPFQHLSVYQKMKAIPDISHVIEFPEFATPTVPAPRSSSGGTPTNDQQLPKKLDHLTTRVRKDVIDCMKSCLERVPKNRAVIPELMEQDWLAMREPELIPPPKPELGSDETIINPYYMRQLLQYGIKLGESQNGGMDAESLLREAERLVAELKSIQ